MKSPPVLWHQEYQQTGIPSSFLETPSGIMNMLYDYLKREKLSLIGKTAADLGCGRGRNSLSLAEHKIQKVYAIDFVQAATERLRQESQKKGFKSVIFPLVHNLALPWPILTNSLDLILDIFCFKHQTDLTKQNFYKNEIERTLKIGGLMVVDLAADDDGYYGNLPRVEVKNQVFKVSDPNTSVGSLLYTKESLLSEFPTFGLIDFANDKKEGQMHGHTYTRSTLKFLLKKID